MLICAAAQTETIYIVTHLGRVLIVSPMAPDGKVQPGGIRLSIVSDIGATQDHQTIHRVALWCKQLNDLTSLEVRPSLGAIVYVVAAESAVTAGGEQLLQQRSWESSMPGPQPDTSWRE